MEFRIVLTSTGGRGAVVGESIEPYKCGEGSDKQKADNMKISHCPLFRKGLIALTPYSLIAFATINLFTYSPMFLIT